MGWKVPSKQGKGKFLEWRLWTKAGGDAVENHWKSLEKFHTDKNNKKELSENVNSKVWLLTCLWWRCEDSTHSKLQKTWVLARHWRFGRAWLARHRCGGQNALRGRAAVGHGGCSCGQGSLGSARWWDSPVNVGGGAAYPQQVLHKKAGVGGKDGGKGLVQRQSGGRSVQPRVQGRRREYAWDHHGPGLEKKSERKLGYSLWSLGEIQSCEWLLTPLVSSLGWEEFYSSLPPLGPPLSADSLNNGAQQSSPHGSLSCSIPRPADWPEDAIYDCIRLHKQARHNVSFTKEAGSSILHVDHFPLSLFCLAEASGLIKEQSLHIHSLYGNFNEDLEKDTLFFSFQGVCLLFRI